MDTNLSANVLEGLEIRGVKCGGELYKNNETIWKMGGRIIMAVRFVPINILAALLFILSLQSYL